jgi:hypothetical protein
VATFRQWETLVAPYVTGHSVPALEDAARAATIDFMQRTRLDTRVIGRVDYDPEEPDTPLPLISNETQPYQAVTVWTPVGRLEPRTRSEMDMKYPDGWVGHTVDSADQLWGWISLRPGIVRLIPQLSIDTVLRLEVCYQPRRTARQVEDYVFDLYGEAISWGTIARLKSHLDVPYSDPAGAGVFSGMFQSEISRLQHRAGVGHNKPRLRSGGDVLT